MLVFIMDFLQTTLGITIITLIAGTVGGLVSHILQRRSQHKTWLFENRITVFSEFLKIFEQCESEMDDYLIKNPNPVRDNDGIAYGMRKVFDPAIARLRVVRLLLDKESRIKFEGLVIGSINLICSKDLEDKTKEVQKKYRAANKEIQDILEQHLSYSDFFTRLRIFIDGS